MFDYVAQPKEQVSTCNLCGSTDYAPVSHGDRYGFPVSMVRCIYCGLEFLNPRMTRNAYRAFYVNGAYRALLSKFYKREITAESIEKEQAEYAERLGCLLKPHLYDRTPEQMLDIGGSTGVVAEALVKRFGGTATVLEPSEPEAKRAKKRDLTVIMGTLEDAVQFHWTDRYDLILLCQTVDHLTDIMGSLRLIRLLLEDHGLLFVDIVDGGDVKIDHPYRLRHKTMNDYLNRAGFKRYEWSRSPDDIHINFVCGRA